MAKSVLYNIYNDLVNAVKTIVDSKYIFLKDRPNTNGNTQPMAKFVVIDLPLGIEDYVIGKKKKTMLSTSGVLYLFTQARSNGTLNINTTGDFTDDVESLFPIKGQYISATKPKVLLKGSDGDGYQVVSISFDLRCRWEAFAEQAGE